MGYRPLIELLSHGRPITRFDLFIVGAPVRHLFMAAAVKKIIHEKGIQEPSFLEVGSFFGASSLTWAFACQHYEAKKASLVCIDPWKPYLESDADVNSKVNGLLKQDVVYSIFMHNINTIPEHIRIVPIREKSNIVLPFLRRNQFDIIYLDGDHSRQAVTRDIRNAAPLVKEGGFLCGDDLNTQLHEMENTEHAYANMKKDVSINPLTGKTYHPGVTLAVAETLGQVSCYGGFWIMQKNGSEWVPVHFSHIDTICPDHFSAAQKADAMAHLDDILPGGSDDPD